MSASAWAAAMEALAGAGDRLAALMAELGEAADPADIHATLLGATMDVWLNRIAVHPDNPAFIPCTGYYQRLGSPNPDTVYRRAPVDSQGTYRISGTRGTSPEVTLMPFTQTMRGLGPFDLSEIAHGPDGQIDVLLSAERPQGYRGDWLPLAGEVESLWLREVSECWGEDAEPRLAIIRLDRPGGARVPAGWSAAGLDSLAQRVERIVEYGIRHAAGLVKDGVINRLRPVDYGASGAMPGQWYHEGAFALADGEALLIEARLPGDLRHFAWSLTDRMLVTLDWMNAYASLNRAQARFDADGVLRAVVATNDPGAPNWLETSGYARGILQFRVAGGEEAPDYSARLVPLDTVFDFLPAGTPRVSPGERRERLLKRQTGAQMRRLW